MNIDSNQAKLAVESYILLPTPNKQNIKIVCQLSTKYETILSDRERIHYD
jgi:hypothetical protein